MNSALFKISYGLYAVTVRDKDKDNALIVNTVTQLTDNPKRVAVTVNKSNFSYGIIEKTGIMNVCCISKDAPFSLFESLGFRSGRDCDKLKGNSKRSKNGLAVLDKYINSYLSLKVLKTEDLGTHGTFLCEITEDVVLTEEETMTYSHYHEKVKPKPETKKKGFVCKICGWVYEGDTLPEDLVCPLCKHGASDFEPL